MIVSFGNNIIDQMSTTGPVRLWDCMTEWARLQPAPDVWDWQRLDSLVDQAGVRSIMLVLGHPPEWAAKGGADGLQAAWMPAGSNRPPKNDLIWSQYVVSVVQRYKGRINQYQIWNEPVDKRFYTGTYDELAFVVRRTRALIRSVDPSAKVVAPPLQPRRQAGWNTRGMQLFTALKKQGFPFDIWSAHIYPQIGEDIPAWNRDVMMVKDRIKIAPKPLWITETNFNLGDFAHNPYPLAKQYRMLDSVRESCYNLRVPRVYWYAFKYSNPQLIGITVT